VLIGKGGSMINEIQAHAEVTVSFAKEDELILGEVLRQVTIYSDSLEANTTAQRIISGTLQSMSQDESAVQMRMLVQSQHVGALIGPQGSVIKSVTQESGAFISFCKDHEMPPGSPHRLLTIVGELESVCMAQHRMTEQHERFLQGQPEGGGGNDSGNPWQKRPRQQSPPTQQAAIQPPSEPSYQQQGATSWRAQASWQSPAAQQALPAGDWPPAGSEQEMSMTLWIPNDHVGLFIGPRGANIKRMVENTHVYVSVQKEHTALTMGDLSGGLAMRPVVFKGPLDAVLQAQKMAMLVLQGLPLPDMAFAMVAMPSGAPEPQQ